MSDHPALLILRPLEQAHETARELADEDWLSHRLLIAPMLHIALLDMSPERLAMLRAPDLAGYLVTSANGARALARLHPRLDAPLLAVGKASAQAARAAGFGDVTSADGDAKALAELAMRRFRPQDGRLIHAAGAHRAVDLGALLAEQGYAASSLALYEARVARALPPAASKALARGKVAAALIHSPRSAEIFSHRLQEAELAAPPIVAISEAAAAPLQAAGAKAVFAERPTQQALFEALRRFLETPHDARA